MGTCNSACTSVPVMRGKQSPLVQIKGSCLAKVVAFLEMGEVALVDVAMSSKTLRAGTWLPTLREIQPTQAFDLLSRLDLDHDKRAGEDEVSCDIFDRIKGKLWLSIFSWIASRGIALPSTLRFPAHSGDAILQMMHGYDASNSARMRFKSLDVSHNKNVTVGGLTRIGSCPALEELNISNLNLDDAALGDLSFKKWKSAQSIRKLDASGNNGITDEGLRRIQDLSSLEDVRLRNCARVTSEGLRSLSTLSKLVTLDVDGCSIDDSGLAIIKDIGSLKKIRLPGPLLTDAGVQNLKALGAIEGT